MQGILQRISKIEELPTLPRILFQVQSIVDSDEGDAKRLGRVIEQDPSLTAKVLKVANSAFFSSPSHRISSIPLAVTRIGFNEVRNLAMAVSLIREFSPQSNDLDYKKFWHHSVAAGYLAQVIADHAQVVMPQDERYRCFLAGLLHDIGILIFDQFFHSEFLQIIRYSEMSSCSFLEAERVVARKDAHPFVGGTLLELWKMDSIVISGVRFHHDPGKAAQAQQNIASVIFLAEYILCSKEKDPFEGTVTDGFSECVNNLGITEDLWGQLLNKAETEMEKSYEIIHDESSGLLRPV
ncbi:MAG: HDOD domain-containing protein [Chitinivibrionales bacterium]|nr:HDOD domain-containing protein [Chitinivibrionales bacterium]